MIDKDTPRPCARYPQDCQEDCGHECEYMTSNGRKPCSWGQAQKGDAKEWEDHQAHLEMIRGEAAIIRSKHFLMIAVGFGLTAWASFYMHKAYILYIVGN